MDRVWIAVIGCFFACRDGSPTSAPAPERAGTTSGSASATKTPRPSLPPETPTIVVPPLTEQQAFEQEPIDRFWRMNTEAQIRQRLPTASDIECHQKTCRITVVGTEHDLAAAVDLMETEQSLRGIAQSILLTAPDQRSDGKLALRAYARFDHPPP